MAPTADVAISKRQAHRALPRHIVPAVPLKFARPPRAAKPATPTEGSPTPVAQHNAEPHSQESKISLPDVHTVHGPSSAGLLTPESKTSAVHSEEKSSENEKTYNTSPSPTPNGSDNLSSQMPGSNATGQHGVAGGNPPSPPLIPDNRDRIGNGHHTVPTPRTELPPPFYPSEKTSYPSLPHGADAPLGVPSTRPMPHVSRPSVDGIVFGATKGSPTMPSTPQEVDHDNRTQGQPILPRSPGFLRPEYASHFHSSHHIPGTQPSWIAEVSPASISAPFMNGGDYHHPQYASHAFTGPYQDRYSPRVTPAALNGAGRSQSQSPIKPHFSGTRPASELGEEHSSLAYRNGSGMPPFVHPIKFEPPFELAEYLSLRLGTSEFADFVLCVRSSESTLLELPVHGIVVARSPSIASVIQTNRTYSHKTDATLSRIELFTHDAMVTPSSVTEVLKVLYGGPLFPIEQIMFRLGPWQIVGDQSFNTQDARKRMSQALSYVAAGKLFQLRSVHIRGFELVRSLLRWDTLEQAMEYALCGSVYARFRSIPHQETTSQEEFEATRFLGRDCVNFIAFNCPTMFKLDRMAPELAQFPRLPRDNESRVLAHNPRLSGIRFGDVPPEADSRPDFVTHILSSILLSLPLALLDDLFRHEVLNSRLGSPAVEKLMYDVIGEREARRLKASENGLGSLPKGVSQRLIDNILYQEQVAGRVLLERRQ